MNIALMAHDSKKELMTQFCIAYCGILSRHSLCATGTTGKLVAEATGLEIQRFLSGSQGGDQQIASRIACNEIDLLLMFRDPLTPKPNEPNEANLLRLCDVHNIPVATNIATAEALIHSLARGDLDWRDIVNPEISSTRPGGIPAGRLFRELFSLIPPTAGFNVFMEGTKTWLFLQRPSRVRRMCCPRRAIKTAFSKIHCSI